MERVMFPQGSSVWGVIEWKEFQKRFIKLEEKWPTALHQALADGLEYARRKIVTEEMSGPRPVKLGVISGRGRASIHWGLKTHGKVIIGEIGSNVWYLPLHEYGLHVFRERRMIGKGLQNSLPYIEKRLTKAGVVLDVTYKGW